MAETTTRNEGMYEVPGWRLEELTTELAAERSWREQAEQALAAERARTRGRIAEAGKMREAIHSALGYISADIDGCDGEDQAFRICVELREALSALVDEGRAVDETADGNEGG